MSWGFYLVLKSVNGVSRKFKGCLKFEGCFKEVLRVFQGGFKSVSRKFQEWVKEVQGCLINVKRVFKVG